MIFLSKALPVNIPSFVCSLLLCPVPGKPSASSFKQMVLTSSESGLVRTRCDEKVTSSASVWVGSTRHPQPTDDALLVVRDGMPSHNGARVRFEKLTPKHLYNIISCSLVKYLGTEGLRGAMPHLSLMPMGVRVRVVQCGAHRRPAGGGVR